MAVSTSEQVVLVSVLYRPPHSFQARLQMALAAGWPVIVFDNGTEPFEVSAPGLSVLGGQGNQGLGVGLHESMKWAYEQGYTHAFYVDQDTVFTLDTLAYVSDWLSNFKGRLTLSQPWAAVGFSAEGDGAWASVPLLINAGSLFHLTHLQQIGWHNPNRFLECIDYDFCLRARQAGFELGLIGACPGLDHKAEQPKHGSGRLYSLARTMAFLRGLLSLSFSAFRRGPRRYACLFMRNVFTHLWSQLWVWLQLKRQAS